MIVQTVFLILSVVNLSEVFAQSAQKDTISKEMENAQPLIHYVPHLTDQMVNVYHVILAINYEVDFVSEATTPNPSIQTAPNSQTEHVPNVPKDFTSTKTTVVPNPILYVRHLIKQMVPVPAAIPVTEYPESIVSLTIVLAHQILCVHNFQMESV